MTSPEAEDMNMISASVVGLLFEKDMKLNKPQNSVDTASLYGHAPKTLWTVIPYMDMHSKILWAVLPYMDIHSKMGGVFDFLVELTRRKNFKKKLTSICAGQHNDGGGNRSVDVSRSYNFLSSTKRHCISQA